MKPCDLPSPERPRERMHRQGAGSLSDAELLALLLRTGLPGLDVVDLARLLLDQAGGSINTLLSSSLEELSGKPGLGPAKAASLVAIRELSRRMLCEPLRRGPPLHSPHAVRDLLQLELASLPHEVFAVVFLDAQNHYLRHEILFRGSLTQTSVYPREVVRRAMTHNAGAVIVAHNHPSGVAEPSRSDRSLTDQLRQTLSLVDVRLLDHFIIAGPDAYSFAEHGLLQG